MGEAVAEVGSTANNYQILARLATGGMAEIFLARGVSQTGVERYCVLKRILRNRANDASFVRMFLDEAKLAAQLQHPHIAQLYDIGKLGDSYFFTMEYVHGETVRSIAQRARSLRRELPLGCVLTIVAGAAAGLHHAHERIGVDGRPLAIVHRDVSPSNLMVSYEGTVKVVDFGVAKANDRANETRSGTVKGKISYLSPEQARGSTAIDRRSDLFAIGIVLWELLTLERLYKRASDFENMSAIVNEPPVPPSTRRAGIPPELDEISLRLLAKNPHDRFQTGDELVEALENVSSRSGVMISASALARFLREMFGQRPEPWIELETAEKEVTVTSEPVPVELAISVGAEAELDFANLPRLTLEAPVPAEDIPTMPQPIVSPHATMIGHSAPAMRVGGSGPLPRLPEPVYPAPQEPERTGMAWQLIAVIAIAAILGSITMFFVMRGSGNETVAADAAVAIEPPIAMQVVTVDAAVVEIDAPVVEPDAAAPEVDEKPARKSTDALLAACRSKNVTKARALLAKLERSKRKLAVQACKSAGLEIEEPADKKTKCETDPMSCQH